MSMGAWLATEGGRKCPACGRYAKSAELGFTGGILEGGGMIVHVTSYGHLPGFGCNTKTAEYLATEAQTTP